LQSLHRRSLRPALIEPSILNYAQSTALGQPILLNFFSPAAGRS
jgi:hypothetical protein